MTLDPQLAAAVKAAVLSQRDPHGQALLLCDLVNEVYDVAKLAGDSDGDGLDGLDSAGRRSLGLVRDQAFAHLDTQLENSRSTPKEPRRP